MACQKCRDAFGIYKCGAKVSGHEGYDMAYIMGDILERSAESPPTMSINARGTCCSFSAQGFTSNGGNSDLVKYDWVYFRRVRISLWQCGSLGMGMFEPDVQDSLLHMVPKIICVIHSENTPLPCS